MTLSRETLLREAEATGFRPEILEKVLRLLQLLQALAAHPPLAGKIALKGGTALNLFHLDLARLSVDIDLNYIGAVERDEMDRDRPVVERTVQAVFAREGFRVARAPSDHAGGKWNLRYAGALSPEANLEVDLNFLLRVPLWEPVRLDSVPVGAVQARAVPVLDFHELAAGKLAALFDRRASRDLFDAHRILLRQGLDEERLRLGFVLYGAMSRTDWRTLSPDAVSVEAAEFEARLAPLLARGSAPGRAAVAGYADRLVAETRSALAPLLAFLPGEQEFLDRLLDHGEIRPDLLTQDPDLARRIATHPGLLWKALNVRRHRGR